MFRTPRLIALIAALVFSLAACASIAPRYEGNYLDGKRHGYGTMVWPDGKRYTGSWVSGREHGRGVYLWPNGDRYEGEYVYGKRHGSGIYTWANGDRYDGEWVDGKMTNPANKIIARTSNTGRPGDYPINELPMYGKREKTLKQKRADKEYIEHMTGGGRSRADAANLAANTGWNHFHAGDKSTAIKRFNQSWLLDHSNQRALWGFAVISMDREQISEAVRYYQMAIQQGEKDPGIRQEYENALKLLEREED